MIDDGETYRKIIKPLDYKPVSEERYEQLFAKKFQSVQFWKKLII